MSRDTLRRIREDPRGSFVLDILVSVAIVAGVAGVLFLVSGLWPPMVAVESGSMQPHMQPGDLVFVVSEDRFVPGNAGAVEGVVTRRAGMESGYRSFGGYGDVIVYYPNGNARDTPVIHRAMRYVERGEEWTDTDGVNRTAEHSGFLTKGDANRFYDQNPGEHISTVVRPSWVKGKAKIKIPLLGRLRLLFPY